MTGVADTDAGKGAADTDAGTGAADTAVAPPTVAAPSRQPRAIEEARRRALPPCSGLIHAALSCLPPQTHNRLADTRCPCEGAEPATRYGRETQGEPPVALPKIRRILPRMGSTSYFLIKLNLCLAYRPVKYSGCNSLVTIRRHADLVDLDASPAMVMVHCTGLPCGRSDPGLMDARGNEFR